MRDLPWLIILIALFYFWHRQKCSGFTLPCIASNSNWPLHFHTIPILLVILSTLPLRHNLTQNARRKTRALSNSASRLLTSPPFSSRNGPTLLLLVPPQVLGFWVQTCTVQVCTQNPSTFSPTKSRRVGTRLEEKRGDVRSRDTRVRKCLPFTVKPKHFLTLCPGF